MNASTSPSDESLSNIYGNSNFDAQFSAGNGMPAISMSSNCGSITDAITWY